MLPIVCAVNRSVIFTHRIAEVFYRTKTYATLKQCEKMLTQKQVKVREKVEKGKIEDKTA